ncbi:MAG: ABC transporter permease [Chloroflexota bacterium]|nr:ABC transporter permease [Chloroflexota bacterium]
MRIISSLLLGFAKAVTRIVAQVRKELIQVRRRPAAFFSLVLGPFLIMAIFGVGYTGVRRPLDTVVAMPANLPIPRDAAHLEGVVGPAINIVAVTEDPAEARAQLDRQQIDALVIVPNDVVDRFYAGQRAELEVYINQVDPTNAAYAEFIAGHVTNQINQQILTYAIREGESYAVQRIGQPVLEIPPDVIAAPTSARVVNIAPTQPLLVTFFAPAVLALILQHMSVTLTALSFVRERLSGTMEIFRISPVSSLELVLGKYIGLGLVGAIIAMVSTLLLVGVLQVPLLGDPWVVAGIVGLLVFASLGIGLFISVVSDSERQAVQLSLLMLLASVFFSGFVLPVHEFTELLQPVAYALPVTHGISLLQDVMLRGTTFALWQIYVLAGIGLAMLILTSALLRRQMRHD